jgi:hypothetical protein
LPEVVAERVDPLLRSRLLLVAPPAAEHGVVAVLGDGVEQGDGLEAVAARSGAGLLDHPPGVDRRLHGGDHELDAELGDAPVAELEHLLEVVTGVDVHHRERDAGGPERLLGQAQHHRRVLAAREEEDRLLELGRDLPDDVDGLGLEHVQMRELRRHDLKCYSWGRDSAAECARQS